MLLVNWEAQISSILFLVYSNSAYLTRKSRQSRHCWSSIHYGVVCDTRHPLQSQQWCFNTVQESRVSAVAFFHGVTSSFCSFLSNVRKLRRFLLPSRSSRTSVGNGTLSFTPSCLRWNSQGKQTKTLGSRSTNRQTRLVTNHDPSPLFPASCFILPDLFRNASEFSRKLATESRRVWQTAWFYRRPKLYKSFPVEFHELRDDFVTLWG